MLVDAVYLMLEYCPAGKLWDVVQPLVNQQLQQQQQEQDEQGALAKPVPGLLKTSESFVLQRQVRVHISFTMAAKDLTVNSRQYIFWS